MLSAKPLPIVYTPPEHGTFEDELHLYRIRGVIVPSVTQVLNEEGFIDFSHVPRHTLQAAQARGTRVHKAVHYWLENDLILDSVWEEDRGYVDSAIGYVENTKRRAVVDADGKTIAVEFRYWDLRYLFGMTVDFLGWDIDDVLAIDDWKTGEPDDVAAPIQTAAYEYGVREALLSQLPKRHKLRSQPIRRRAVKLFRDGRPGRPEPYNDPRDFMVFLNALSCAHYRRNGMKHDTPASRELRRLLDGYV